jgi:hypothetical protein
MGEALRRFSKALDAYPAAFRGNPLNLLLLDEASPIMRGTEYLRRLGGPGLMSERREYLCGEASDWPFPEFCVEERPDPWSLSLRLFDNFELARTILPTQSDVARRIEARALQMRAEVVAFVIVDGLSYYDLGPDVGAEPCLVDGVTTTEHGYRAAVGDPSVARRLFAHGYAKQAAFTYFAIGSDGLAADVHDVFSPPQVLRVRAFGDIVDSVARLPRGRSYIQVTLAGLDHLCHAHHDEPPIGYYRDEMLQRFDSLLEVLASPGRRVLGVLCADHGILWRGDIEGRLELVDDLFDESARWPRYTKGALLRHYGRVCRTLGQTYTLFRIPYMTRRFRNNEWGVHGGISAWESIVPLIIKEIV